MTLRKISAKQAKAQREMSKVWIQVMLEYDGLCTGCGTNRGLTLSHIIRRSRRKDLETEFRNIKPHCVSCHHKWDSGNILLMFELNDFEDNVRYIKEVDHEYYQILQNKLADLLGKNAKKVS